MIDLKPYYQVKLALLTYKASFSGLPKTEGENTPMILFKSRIGSMRKRSKCLILRKTSSY